MFLLAAPQLLSAYRVSLAGVTISTSAEDLAFRRRNRRGRAVLRALVISAWLSLTAVAQAADEDAPNHRPVKVVGDQRLEVRSAAGSGQLAMFASRDWQGPAAQPDITRALLVFHGRLRNADVYLQSALRAAQLADEVGRHTLLIAPQFLADVDMAARSVPPDTLHWRLDGWMGGDAASGPAPISSFEAIDAILERLADRSRFPNLARVVVAGHSAGGQVVQRYAVVGQGEADLTARGVKVRYVVANPSSYLYFSDERPGADGTLAPFSPAACPGFDRWKYGWAEAPEYARRRAASDYEARYVMRDVIYLLGRADIDPRHPALDKSCAGEAQGPFRYARGQSYVRYLRARHPALQQREWDVPGVAHDGERMLTSPCGLAALFDDPAAAASCSAPTAARDDRNRSIPESRSN